MAGVQLYDGLIKATEQIVAKFGEDVLMEDRFVNILQDLYPDRDNPAIFRIIKSIINDGYCSDLLLCDKNTIQDFVSKTALALNQKNGYDKQLVEVVIYSLMVGCKLIDQSKAKVPIPPKLKRRSNNSPQPPKHRPVRQPSSSHSLYIFLYLSLAFFGLFLSPVVYMLAITGAWWPSFTLMLILVIQAVFFSISYNHLRKKKPLPVIGGSFSAIIFCAVIFVAFAPFYAESNATKEVIYYFNIPYGHDMWMPYLTLMISVIYLGFVNIGGKIAGYDLTLLLEVETTGQLIAGKAGLSKLISDIKFMKGFVITGFFVLFVGGVIVNLPTMDAWKNRIINTLLIRQRSSISKQLSFADFQIGSDIDSCIHLAISSPAYCYNDKKSSAQSFLLKDGSSVPMDSVISVKTVWYEDTVYLELNSLKGKLMAIDISTNRFNQINILALFLSKYGKPEYEKYKNLNLITIEENYLERWVWTFKNGIIQMGDGYISYYDRYLESVAAENIEKEKKIELMRQRRQKREEQLENERRRKQDSLNKIRLLEEEKRKELERKKAIDQI